MDSKKYVINTIDILRIREYINEIQKIIIEIETSNCNDSLKLKKCHNHLEDFIDIDEKEYICPKCNHNLFCPECGKMVTEIEKE